MVVVAMCESCREWSKARCSAGFSPSVESRRVAAEGALNAAFEFVERVAIGLTFVPPQDPAVFVEQEKRRHVLDAELRLDGALRAGAEELAVVGLMALAGG